MRQEVKVQNSLDNTELTSKAEINAMQLDEQERTH
jgi:hypothetical protein